jgi:branched-subunit amino acid transport protein AzlD
MSKTTYAIIVILAVGALSLLIRALPFLLFGRGGRPPKAVAYVGRVLSPAAIAMLAVYCYAGYVCERPPAEHLGMLAEVAAGALTVGLQWRWRCPPLSIAAGTALYMALVRMF